MTRTEVLEGGLLAFCVAPLLLAGDNGGAGYYVLAVVMSLHVVAWAVQRLARAVDELLPRPKPKEAADGVAPVPPR